MARLFLRRIRLTLTLLAIVAGVALGAVATQTHRPPAALGQDAGGLEQRLTALESEVARLREAVQTHERRGPRPYLANTFVNGGEDRLYLRLWDSDAPTAPLAEDLTVCAERVEGDGSLHVSVGSGGNAGHAIGVGSGGNAGNAIGVGAGPHVFSGAGLQCRRLTPALGASLLQLEATPGSGWAVSVHADE